MKKLVLLSILFLFVTTAGFCENRPPGKTDKLEMSFDQPSAEMEMNYAVMHPLVEIGVYFIDARSAMINCFIETEYVSVIRTVLEEGSSGDYSTWTNLTHYTNILKRHAATDAYVYDFDYSCNKLLKQS